MFYKFCKAIISIIFHILYRIEIYGEEPTEQGPLIICANHMSLLDPFLLAVVVKRPISFMAKKELFQNKILAYFLKKANVFPVDRTGLDMKSVKHAISLIKEGECLGIFPEGTRVNTVNVENMKEGIGFIATQSKAFVQPIFIEGEYKFRKPMKVYYRDMIDSNSFEKLKTKAKIKEITHAVYKEIYDLESE